MSILEVLIYSVSTVIFLIYYNISAKLIILIKREIGQKSNTSITVLSEGEVKRKVPIC